MEKKISKSHEDYLEAIVELGGTPKQSVRSVDVAANLGVSKASVNKAIGSLKEEGLVDQPYYGDITFTDDGYTYGKKVVRRHQLLYAFLTKELGIDEEVADKEACLMEHAISDDSFEKWTTYIEKIEKCHPGCEVFKGEES